MAALPPQEPPAEGATLAEQIASLLAALGGRTAVAAQRIGGPASARTLPVRQARAGERDEHDHEHPAPLPDLAERSIRLRADEVFSAASLAKLPIAVELLRRADLGQFDLSERFETAHEPRVGGGSLLDALDPATSLTLADLCALMLAASDNTAANFLLDLVGMGEINETITRMNLKQTHIARRFMDFEAQAAHRENTTSAADMLELLSLVRGGALPGAPRLRAMLAAQLVANDLRAWLPPHAQLAHKEGSLDGMAHDAGIVTGPGGSCVYCVLTSEQADLPMARATIGRVLRHLWQAWCAGPA